MKNMFVKFMAVALVALLSCGVQLQAQNLLKGLKEKAEKAVKGNVGNSGNSGSTTTAAKGKTYYVSV